MIFNNNYVKKMWIQYEYYCKFTKSEFEKYSEDFRECIENYGYMLTRGFINSREISEFVVIYKERSLFAVCKNENKYVLYKIMSAVSKDSEILAEMENGSFGNFISKLDI